MRPKNNRIHTIITASMAVICVASGILAWLSLSQGLLYSPVGKLEINEKNPNFYIGISVYITIGATLLTSVLIRIGLRMSR